MAYRFKLDENVPLAAKAVLIEQGHDALTVLDQHLGGKDDDKIATVCAQEDRILVTIDLDFSDIRKYPPGSNPGIWILRPLTQSVDNCVALVRHAVVFSKTESPERALWIVESGKIRIRTSHEV